VPDGRQRILEASLMAFREKGYAATTVDDLCRVAGVTKGAFFHHFENKEDAALEAIALWNARTRELFEGAPWSQVEDPRERLMAYLDFRARLANEGLPGLACLPGTLAQEIYASHPALRAACEEGIEAHVRMLVPVIEAAKARYAPQADWSAEGLARHVQAVLQGSFVLAKVTYTSSPVPDAVDHLKRYVSLLIPPGNAA